jgi:tRNA-specific 2-thiouridylase
MLSKNHPVVFVAMSGGVDSTIAAFLLQQSGYTVRGVHLLLWPPGPHPAPSAATLRAEDAARRMGIDFQILDWREQFQAKVIDPYLNELSDGLTPNPCVRCNRQIKWGALLRFALAQGAEQLASGHYARLVRGEDGLVSLWRGRDRSKDQSYFLSALNQDTFQHMLFPLADMTKAEVRQLAAGLDLPSFEGQESQDLCFLGAGGQEEFLQTYAPQLLEPGEIVDSSGAHIGQHPGLALFTVGQRRNIRVAGPEPYYVLRKDLEHNRLVVGFKDELSADGILATDVNWISGSAPDLSRTYQMKIRSAASPAEGQVQILPNGDIITRLEKPLRDITAGQRLVIYDGDQCLGSALIIESRG